ncbi:MAG TPA: magnesium/cobalt transporter CorA [Armatimonadota bacterium]
MLSLQLREKGKVLEKQDDISKISDYIVDPTNIVWVDALSPDAQEMELLACEFGFHPLSIEDYYTPHPRPKVDVYPNYYFIVVHALEFSVETSDLIPVELVLFLGANYIVTVHREPMGILDHVCDIWKREPRLLNDGSGMLLYDILDGLVDSYFPILDEVDDRIDQIEDDIFGHGHVASVESTFRLKRSLLILRRITAPLRDVLNTLIRRDQPLLSDQSVIYLRDIYDHTLRITDTVDTYRDILTGALDAYLTVISNQMNAVMKTLTVVTTILVSMQVISGIYGMNFLNMPELHWRFGYPLAIGFMVLSSLGLLHYFKRIKWL